MLASSHVISGETAAHASQLASDGNGQLSLIGDATLQQDDQQLSAQRIEYNQHSDAVHASGNARYATPSLEINSEAFDVNTRTGALDTAPADFRIRLKEHDKTDNFPAIGNGNAQKISRTENGITTFDEVDYSTCPPGEAGWLLSASSLQLDPNKAEGTATNVSLAFKGVPFFYSPWFSFPIGDTRKSGFLTPRLTISSTRGNELQTPWYWNIAPQADATLTPRVMSKRGVQLISEWRYLNDWGNWQLDSEYLGNDRETNSRRDFAQLRHAGNPFGQWTSNLDISRVSDDAYFDDFGDSFTLSNLTHLRRRADLLHSGNDAFSRSTFRVRLEEYQTIDDSIGAANRPYQRLPQITYDITLLSKPNQLNVDLKSEWVHFDRTDSVIGERLHLRPRLQLPLASTYGFFRPSLSIWHSQYQLDNTSGGEPDNIDLSVPVFSIDSGLYFDRISASGTQTLEPRLFYLRVPYEDQSAIPDFDTSTYTFGFSQLFRENRFSGGDRIGDTNQLTLALTSRQLDNSGREQRRASIGQIFYVDDRRVSIGDGSTETADRSNLIVELRAELGAGWSASGTWQRDPERKATHRGSSQLRFSGANRTRFSLSHRYVYADYEQSDIAFSVALNPRWRAAARWNYSLNEERGIDSLVALDYESCCWAFRSALRRYAIDDGKDTTNALYFELVMKGLGSVGDNIGTQLERDILGYSNRYP